MCFAGCRDFLLVVLLWGAVGGKELVWKYDSDIGNPENWVGGKPGADCKGLHFAAVNSAPVLIHELVAAEVTLPRDGEVVLEANGFIEFKDNKKCINLKPFTIHDWYDPESWRLKDPNVAVPDEEKIPCANDDVTFPNIVHTSVTSSMSRQPHVGSINIHQQVFTARSVYYFPIGFTVEVYKKTCDDPYGCLCHDTNIFCPAVDDRPDTKKLPCQDPVVPEDSCHEICGAYVTYKPGDGPNLAQVAEKLKEFDEIDVHASRVRTYLGSEVIQIVFSEKEYTGRSLEHAESFLDFLKGASAQNAQIVKSGQFYMEGGNSWGMVFGTLFGVLVVFGVLFYLHGDNNIDLIISRLQRSRSSIFVNPFFARFHNTDENQSDSGSILDIAKSFDNPLYGQSTTAAPIAEENKSQGTTFDNPVFGQSNSKKEEPMSEETKPLDFDNPLYGQSTSDAPIAEERPQGTTFDDPIFEQSTSEKEEPMSEEIKPLDFENPLYETPLLVVSKAPEAEE